MTLFHSTKFGKLCFSAFICLGCANVFGGDNLDFETALLYARRPVDSRDRTEAVRLFDLALTSTPTGKQAAEICIQVARLYSQAFDRKKESPDFQKSIAWYKKALVANGDDMSTSSIITRVELASIFSSMGEFTAANSLLRKITSSNLDAFFKSELDTEMLEKLEQLSERDKMHGIDSGSESHKTLVAQRLAIEKSRLKEIYDVENLIAHRALIWNIYRSEGLSAANTEADKFKDQVMAKELLSDIIKDYGNIKNK